MFVAVGFSGITEVKASYWFYYKFRVNLSVALIPRDNISVPADTSEVRA